MNTSLWGDRALLLAIVAVGALPFLGWAIGQPAKGWELGLGALAILAAGASLLMDLLPPKSRR